MKNICDTMNGLMRSDFDCMPKEDFLKDYPYITEEVYEATKKEFENRIEPDEDEN